MEFARPIKDFVEGATWDWINAHSEGDVTIEPHWVQQVTPYAPTSFLNGIYKFQLSENEIEVKVKQVVANYAAKKLPFRWKVSESSRPENLRQHLLASGLGLKDRLLGLYCDPSVIAIKSRPDVIVQELSENNLDDWLLVQSTAWNVPPPGIEYLRRVQLQVLNAERPGATQLIGYFAGRPVSTAALQFKPDYGFLMGGAVNPECRGLGIYSTLLAHRLRLIADRKLPAVVHCLEHTSAPICLRLGFTQVCVIESYEPSL